MTTLAELQALATRHERAKLTHAWREEINLEQLILLAGSTLVREGVPVETAQAAIRKGREEARSSEKAPIPMADK